MKFVNKRNFILFFLPLVIISTIQIVAFNYIEPITFDSKEYIGIAESIYENGEYAVKDPGWERFEHFKGENPTRMRQPGYPLFLSATYWLFGESVSIVLAIQFLLNILSFIILIKIAELIFGDQMYPLTGILLALYFPFWVLSANILTETLFSFLLIISIYFFVKAIIENRNLYYLLSGLMFGISFLTRPIALFVFLAAIIPLVLAYNFKETLKKWSLILAALIIIISPWFIRNAIVLGDFTPLSSDGGFNIWKASLGFNVDPWNNSEEFYKIVGNGYYIDNESGEKFLEKGIGNNLNHPFESLKNGFLRIFNTWTYFPGTREFADKKLIFLTGRIIQSAILLLALAGLLLVNNRKLKIILFIPAIGFTFVLLFSNSTARYLIPSIPLIILLTAEGLKYLFLKLGLKNK